ncbi:MAG: hypothetical protein NZ823_13325 [Blastocatellia bacterium]|nr:hypothetical protein [Blastocatellia bacterium]
MMNDAHNRAYDPDALPTEHLLKCVWMLAKVVDYKLCDQAYDCEHCAFDQVMRGQQGASPAQRAPFDPVAIETLIEELRRLTSGASAEVGITLQDGGTPVTEAGHWIDARRLQSILDKFLSTVRASEQTPSQHGDVRREPGGRR